MIPSQATADLVRKIVLFAIAFAIVCTHRPRLFADERSQSPERAPKQLLGEDLEKAKETIGRLIDAIDGTPSDEDSALPLIAAAWNRILIAQSSDE